MVMNTRGMHEQAVQANTALMPVQQTTYHPHLLSYYW
jgi:hypothetical protein